MSKSTIIQQQTRQAITAATFNATIHLN
ncbi:unnamed protein product, partial [Adineta steineri]